MLDFYHFNHLSTYPKLLHKITTKDTLKPYSFSLALHTGENLSDILSNRTSIKETFDNDNLCFILANQTHSDNISIITHTHTRGWQSQNDALKDCDSLITNQKNIILAVLTADCVPILLFDPVKNIVAAIHAGWKGTQSQIVSKTVEKMYHTFDSNPQDILAGIAPSIGKCCYEVGEDVARHFKNIPHAYSTKENQKYMLDLPHINKTQLLQVGLKEENIEMSNICTACQVDRFFSYRKENGCSGRFMSMIGMKGSK